MKQSSLLKNGLWITYASFITRIFGFLSSLVLARLLQPSDFGIIGIAYVFWSFFTLFTQDTAGTFIIYKGTENPKYVNTAYTISLLIGAAFGLGLIAVSPFIAQFFNEPVLTWILIAFAFNLVLSSANYVYSGVLTRHLQYQTLANISLVSSFTRLLFTAGAALLGLRYWSFVIGDTASWLVTCGLTRHYSRHPFRLSIDPELRSEVLSFCLNSTGSSFGFYLNANADNFTVGKVLGSASLGYYNLAYQLTMALSTVFNSVIGQLGLPIFAQMSNDRQQESTLLKVVEFTGFCIAPIYGLIFLMIDPQVISFVFGDQWQPIRSVIPGLLVFAYLRVMNTPINSMLRAKGRPDLNSKVNLQIAPIAVASFVIGAYVNGIVGVSLAAALVLGLGWTVYWWWVACRSLGWSVNQFLLPCFLPIALCVPGMVIGFNLPLFMKPLVFLLIYILSLRFFVPRQYAQYQLQLSHLVGKLRKKYL